MKSRSTGMLAVSDLDQVGNWSNVRADLSHQTPGPIDNVISLFVKIRVEI